MPEWRRTYRVVPLQSVHRRPDALESQNGVMMHVRSPTQNIMFGFADRDLLALDQQLPFDVSSESRSLLCAFRTTSDRTRVLHNPPLCRRLLLLARNGAADVCCFITQQLGNRMTIRKAFSIGLWLFFHDALCNALETMAGMRISCCGEGCTITVLDHKSGKF